MIKVAGMLASMLVGISAALVLGGCSQDEIVVDGPRASSTVTLSDGAATDAQVSAVVVRLSRIDPGALDADPTARAAVLAIGLRAVGMTPEEVACIGSAPEATAPPSTTAPVASPVAGVAPEVLARCVSGTRLAALAAKPSVDLSVVPRDEVAAAVTPIVRRTLVSDGLNEAEADCVVTAAVGSLDEAGLVSLIGGSGTAVGVDATAVRGCLTPARIAALAG